MAQATRPHFHRLMRSALHLAEKHGSDFWVAVCGYDLASTSPSWTASGDPCTQECPPSMVLRYLQQAGEAHSRCTALLPRPWMAGHQRRKERAFQNKAWLEQLVARGDRWEAKGPGAVLAAAAKTRQLCREGMGEPAKWLTCCSCGVLAMHLRHCAGCMKSAYCR